MFHNSAAGASEFYIYRSGEDQWGDSPNKNEGPVSRLHGKLCVGKAVGLIAPNTSEIWKTSEDWAQSTYSTKSLYTDIDADIRPGDYVYWVNYSGRPEVWEVESDGSQDYVSPFTGMVAGKEVRLGTLQLRK